MGYSALSKSRWVFDASRQKKYNKINSRYDKQTEGIRKNIENNEKWLKQDEKDLADLKKRGTKSSYWQANDYDDLYEGEAAKDMVNFLINESLPESIDIEKYDISEGKKKLEYYEELRLSQLKKYGLDN